MGHGILTLRSLVATVCAALTAIVVSGCGAPDYKFTPEDAGTGDGSVTVDSGPPPVECTNRQKDGTETDVDCGGGVCTKCGTGSACEAPSDCVSGVCSLKVCQAPTCGDNVKNQDESDVDCGGTKCTKCA